MLNKDQAELTPMGMECANFLCSRELALKVQEEVAGDCTSLSLEASLIASSKKRYSVDHDIRLAYLRSWTQPESRGLLDPKLSSSLHLRNDRCSVVCHALLYRVALSQSREQIFVSNGSTVLRVGK